MLRYGPMFQPKSYLFLINDISNPSLSQAKEGESIPLPSERGSFQAPGPDPQRKARPPQCTPTPDLQVMASAKRRTGAVYAIGCGPGSWPGLRQEVLKPLIRARIQHRHCISLDSQPIDGAPSERL